MKFPTFLASRICAACKQHNAKFTFHGKVKRDRQHDICYRCYRSLRDRNAAWQLSVAARPRIVAVEMSSYFYRQLLEQPWAKKASLSSSARRTLWRRSS